MQKGILADGVNEYKFDPALTKLSTIFVRAESCKDMMYCSVREFCEYLSSNADEIAVKYASLTASHFSLAFESSCDAFPLLKQCYHNNYVRLMITNRQTPFCIEHLLLFLLS